MRTLAELRSQVTADLDLEDDDFISKSDINTWIREAIRQAEAQIHTIYENYFLVEHTIPISLGNNLYDYPSASHPTNPAPGDIFANKIVKIHYSSGQGSGSQTHEVKRLRNLIEGKEMDIKMNDSVEPMLCWCAMNDNNGRKIRLFPSNGRNGELSVFYIRNANVLNQDADECDIDEFEHYVVQYAKTQAYLKDGDPRFQASKALEEQYKTDMINTLTNMSPDDNNELDMDLGHYSDSV